MNDGRSLAGRAARKVARDLEVVVRARRIAIDDDVDAARVGDRRVLLLLTRIGRDQLDLPVDREERAVPRDAARHHVVGAAGLLFLVDDEPARPVAVDVRVPFVRPELRGDNRHRGQRCAVRVVEAREDALVA